MLDIDNLQDLRDLTIVAFTIAGTVLFLVAIIFAIIVGILAVAVLRGIKGTVRNNVQPTLETVRETMDNVRGAATFISDTAVSPIIRIYSLWAGLRRFLAVFFGFLRRVRRRPA